MKLSMRCLSIFCVKTIFILLLPINLFNFSFSEIVKPRKVAHYKDNQKLVTFKYCTKKHACCSKIDVKG